jgi:hypothetical protein
LGSFRSPDERLRHLLDLISFLFQKKEERPDFAIRFDRSNRGDSAVL